MGFRLNSELAARGQWSKFGFDLNELEEALHLVGQSPALEWAGLHFHCSWNKTPRKYLENIRTIGQFLAKSFSAHRLQNLRFFDIGGGFYPEGQGSLNKGEDKGILLEMLGHRREDKEALFKEMGFDPHGFSITPVEPLENFARDISASLQEHILSLNPRTCIYFEPGRFIAGSSTTVLLAVTAVKKNGIIVDGGINMLGDHGLAEYSFAPIINLSRPSTSLRRRVIYGPLCDPGDLWGYSYFGEGVEKGDILAVLNQGAYTFSTAWRFIKPIPPYIMHSGGKLSIARTVEKFRHRYAGCRF